MKRTTLIAALTVVLAGCLAGYAALGPEALLRQELARSVHKATGRDLTIQGGASVTLAPAFAITFHKISFGAPPDAPGEPLLEAESVKVEADLLPLLMRRVKVRRVVLNQPNLNLLVDGQGRPNWAGLGPVKLQSASTPEASVHTLEPAETPADGIPPGSSEPSGKYEGDSGRDAQTVQAPPHRRNAGRKHGEGLEEATLHIENGVVSYRDLARGADFRLTRVDLTLRPDLASNSLEAAGAASVSEERLEYRIRAGIMNGLPLTGVPLALEVASRRGNISLDGQASLTNENGRPGAACFGQMTANAEGFGSFSGSVEIMGDSGFLNATARPSVLTYKNFTAQGGMVNIRAEHSSINARFEDMSAYGGAARGDLKIDARLSRPVVSGSAVIENVASLRLLTNLSQFDWLSGTGAVSMTFSGTGSTAAQIAQTLSGEARLSLNDGALEGIDLPRMLRSAQNGVFHWSRNHSERTPFDRFTANFTITGGVAKTADLSLAGPNVSMSGDGSVDLAQESLDLRLKPRITAAPDDRSAISPSAGAKTDFIEIPLIVRGRWEKPRIEPDLNKALADPATAAASAKTLAKPLEKLTGGAIKSEDVGKVIDSLFGRKKKQQ